MNDRSHNWRQEDRSYNWCMGLSLRISFKWLDCRKESMKKWIFTSGSVLSESLAFPPRACRAPFHKSYVKVRAGNYHRDVRNIVHHIGYHGSNTYR